MRVLTTDNHDSFTYNFVQYLGELGTKALVRRNDELTSEEVDALHPSRIVFPLGTCTPNEADGSLAVVDKASAMRGMRGCNGASRRRGTARSHSEGLLAVGGRDPLQNFLGL